MLKKSMLLALVLVASQAHAATWDYMMKRGNVTFYMERGSNEVAREAGQNTVRSHFRLDYDKPLKTSTDKYYSRETVWLSMDCAAKEFLANSSEFSINNQVVGTNNGRNRKWTRYNPNSTASYHVLWRQTCLQ